MEINQSSAIPLYKQVSHIIEEEIKDGIYNVGDKIPSEQELINKYKVSRITIRLAMKELADEGLLIRKQGKGTFVAKQKAVFQANDLSGFSESCRNLNKIPTTEVINFGYKFPNEKECQFFNIQKDTQILTTTRLRSIDGVPTVVENNVYSPKLTFLVDENLSESLFEIFKRHGINTIESKRSLEITSATIDFSKLLNIKTGKPLLLFTDLQFEDNDLPLFISKQYYSTENMMFYL